MIQARLLPTSLQPEVPLETYRTLVAQGRQAVAQERLKSRGKALEYARHIRERGYNDGYAAGLKAAQEQCQAAIQALKARYDDALDAAKSDSQQIAQGIAEQIIDKTLLEKPAALAKWINEAVALVKRARTFKLGYNPRYEPIIQRVVDGIPKEITVYPDPSLSEKDFILEADTGGVEFAWRQILATSGLRVPHTED
jgi:flagellar biosynthesis/type III secretory pathway protein FliH